MAPSSIKYVVMVPTIKEIAPGTLVTQKFTFTPLEKKLHDLGEKVKIVGQVKLDSGVYHSGLDMLVDGIQVSLSGQISERNFSEIKEFLSTFYNEAYITKALLKGPYSGEVPPVYCLAHVNHVVR